MGASMDIFTEFAILTAVLFKENLDETVHYLIQFGYLLETCEKLISMIF